MSRHILCALALATVVPAVARADDPPAKAAVRASATVEVVDDPKKVDDIIERVRRQREAAKALREAKQRELKAREGEGRSPEPPGIKDPPRAAGPPPRDQPAPELPPRDARSRLRDERSPGERGRERELDRAHLREQLRELRKERRERLGR